MYDVFVLLSPGLKFAIVDTSFHRGLSHPGRFFTHRRTGACRFNLRRNVLLIMLLSCCLPHALFGAATATMISPAPGGVLPGSSVTFSWTAGSGVTAYALYLGTTGEGSNDLYAPDSTTATSATVTGLPTNGVTIYATLYSLVNGVWQAVFYTYSASAGSAMAALTSPAPGSVLSGSSVTFSWSAGSGVTAYALHLGSTGPLTKDLFDSGVISATSITATGLPTNGATIYASVYSEINGVWQPNGYTYTAATLPTAATITSPAPGSVLPGPSVTFSWTQGTEVTAYALHLSSTGPLGKDLFDSGVISATSITVTGLPTNAATIYASVYSEINGVWEPVSYTYTAANTSVAAALSALSCGSVSLTGAGTDVCTVTLNALAPSGGLSVSLSSSSSAVSVPTTITVPANAASASFTATVSAVGAAQTIALTASAGGVSKSLTLSLLAVLQGLNINSTSVAFGNVPLNATATQDVTLTAVGILPVTVNSATVTGTGFTMAGNPFPLTLIVGQAVTLSLQFDPTTAGVATGQLTITTNAATGATTAIGLSGTGTSYEVDLSWGAPTSSASPVTGYYVFRSLGGSSAYALLNSSPTPKTTFVDGSVQSGITYDYVIESVDGAGIKSAPSNVIAVTIP